MSPLSHRLGPAQRPVATEAWRHWVAHVLRLASTALARHARDVARPLQARRRRLPQEPVVEFHAEAGAPEGALYVDGQFIGHIDVRRL
jgi:hypothetical protein